MQSITWVQMVQEAPASTSLVEKVLTTISGNAPCDHCKALQAEKLTEQEKEATLLSNSQTVAPLSLASHQLSHTRKVLFAITEPQSGKGSGYIFGIDHPPRA